MPELPEVETIVRQLARVLPGKTIKAIDVLREKSLQGQTSQVIGKTISAVSRKQKVIEVSLAEGGAARGSSDVVLLIHLKMTGQLIFQSPIEKEIRGKKKEIRIVGGSSTTALARLRLAGGHPTKDWVGELPSNHTRVVFRFTDGSTLYFNDQRVFGWVKIAVRAEWNEVRAKLPPDVVDPAFTVEYLHQVLQKSTRPIKLVILDQDKMGGMGNIYANDALFLARIHPLRKANSLTQSETIKLHQALITVLTKGIETGGASYSHFVDTQGLGGHYQEHFLVYDQAGKPCHTCGQRIEKISLGGRGTYFCPKCQR